MRMLRLVMLVFVAILGALGSAAAQGTTASISVFVTDATRAAVPGATVPTKVKVGIIAKRTTSVYEPGRESRDWRRIARGKQ